MNEESRRWGREIIRIQVGPQVAREKRFEELMENIKKNMAFMREHLGTTVREAAETMRSFGKAVASAAKVQGWPK